MKYIFISQEKEKELDVQNIYSHRISKAPSRLRAMSETNQMRLSVSKSMSIEDLQSSSSPRNDSKPSPRHENRTRRSSSFSEKDASRQMKKREVRAEPDTTFQRKEPEPEPETIHRDIELTAKGSEEFEITNIEEERKSPKEVVVKEDRKPVETPRKEKTFEKKKEETKVEEEKEDEHLKILRMLDADVQNLETKKPVAAAATTNPSSSESKSEENKGKVGIAEKTIRNGVKCWRCLESFHHLKY